MVPATNIKKIVKVNALTGCLFFILLTFLLPAAACIAAAIKGRVIDQQTAYPLTGVMVRVLDQAITVYTDKAGNYEIKELARGGYTLRFSAKNYQEQLVHVNLDETTVTVSVGLKKRPVDLNEVIVVSSMDPRSTLRSRLTEKTILTSTDIVSGDLIEHSGSISAADAVQHVPGISLTSTSTGAGEKVIIRGMEPKYSYTLVNGLKIPSPDDKSRYVSFDIFPAGLLEKVQVDKTLTAAMEGDAIGGVINLVMRKPPESFLFQAGVNTGYSVAFVNQSYRSFDSHAVANLSPYERFGPGHYAGGADFSKNNLSFSNGQPLPDVAANVVAGNTFFGGKLGFMVAADYKNIKTGSDGYFIPLNAQPNLHNVPAFSDFYNRRYSNNKIAVSTADELTCQLDPFNKFTLTYFFLDQKDVETRSSTDTSLTLGRSSAGTGRIYISDRSRVHEQVLNAINLGGSHHLDRLAINWTGAYSSADGRYPDWAELTANTGRLLNAEGSITQTPLLLAPLTRIWLHNDEKDLDLYLDLHYHPAFFQQKLTLSGGALLRDKTRNNFYNSYVFSPEINEPFTNIYNAIWVNNNGPQNPLGNVNNANTYHARELINAWYILADLRDGRSEFSGGIRLEQTAQNFVSALDASVSYGQQVAIDYKDLLPDLHWKYQIDSAQQIRASYYKAISRPALYDITFAVIDYEDYNIAGNPFLKRTQADNFDLNYQWNQSLHWHLKAGFFYKHIIDAYEKTLLNGNDELYPIAQNGLSYTPANTLTEQLKNTGPAVNYGAEAGYSFDWKNISIFLNYTFTSSTVTRMKKLQTREHPDDPSSNIITTTKPETGPLEGQSRNLAGLDLLYKNNAGTWLLNFSINYLGKRIALVSPWYGLDYWQRQRFTANISAERKIFRHFTINLSAQNLFNNGLTDDILMPNPNGPGNNELPGQQQSGRITVLRQNFYAYYQFGLRYRFTH